MDNEQYQKQRKHVCQEIEKQIKELYHELKDDVQVKSDRQIPNYIPLNDLIEICEAILIVKNKAYKIGLIRPNPDKPIANSGSQENEGR